MGARVPLSINIEEFRLVRLHISNCASGVEVVVILIGCKLYETVDGVKVMGVFFLHANKAEIIGLE
jgi:hypothetical protein